MFLNYKMFEFYNNERFMTHFLTFKIEIQLEKAFFLKKKLLNHLHSSFLKILHFH